MDVQLKVNINTCGEHLYILNDAYTFCNCSFNQERVIYIMLPSGQSLTRIFFRHFQISGISTFIEYTYIHAYN